MGRSTGNREPESSLDQVPAGGSFNMIPPLLMPGKLSGGVLTHLKAPERAEDDKLGKVACFRIEGTWGDRPITVWIDKKSYLVRRFDQQYEVNPSKGESFRVEDTTTYDPTIDKKIADKLLEFDLPAPARALQAKPELLPCGETGGGRAIAGLEEVTSLAPPRRRQPETQVLLSECAFYTMMKL